MGRFAIVPAEVLQDDRLTFNQMRVLLALLTFRPKDGDYVFPRRETIAEACRLPPTKVSVATTDLERLGWLKKEGNGGKSRASRYTFLMPDYVASIHPTDAQTVTDSVTVTETVTVTESGSVSGPNGYRFGIQTVTESVRGKELSINKEKKQQGDLLSQVPAPAVSKKSALLCPVSEIIEAYHEQMPENPRVKVVSEKRKRLIAARWKQAATMECRPFGYDTREAGIEAWREFFAVCAASDFLTGKTKPTEGRPPFYADIDFLMSETKFAAILENKYHREAA
nr:helix-turn-helix domain-containing protein [Dechloromonas sp.]